MEQLNVPEEMKIPIDYGDQQIPASVKTFRPLLYQEGESFCCILGPDPQSGIFGCGKTPQEALEDWDVNLSDRIKYHTDDDEIARYIADTLKASVKKVW